MVRKVSWADHAQAQCYGMECSRKTMDDSCTAQKEEGVAGEVRKVVWAQMMEG